MPVPSGYSSLYFNSKEITIYLKSLDYYYKDHSIKDNAKKKERTAKYTWTNKKRDIKRLLEYKDTIL